MIRFNDCDEEPKFQGLYKSREGNYQLMQKEKSL